MAVVFSATSLAAILLGSIVCLDVFVGSDYVQTWISLQGITFFAFWLVQLHLTLVGRRRRCMARHFVGGFLGFMVAFVLAWVYVGCGGGLVELLGYSWSRQKEIALMSVGAVLFAAVSATFHWCYLSKRSDNNSVAPTRAPEVARGSP